MFINSIVYKHLSILIANITSNLHNLQFKFIFSAGRLVLFIAILLIKQYCYK